MRAVVVVLVGVVVLLSGCRVAPQNEQATRGWLASPLVVDISTLFVAPDGRTAEDAYGPSGAYEATFGLFVAGAADSLLAPGEDTAPLFPLFRAISPPHEIYLCQWTPAVGGTVGVDGIQVPVNRRLGILLVLAFDFLPDDRPTPGPPDPRVRLVGGRVVDHHHSSESESDESLAAIERAAVHELMNALSQLPKSGLPMLTLTPWDDLYLDGSRGSPRARRVSEFRLPPTYGYSVSPGWWFGGWQRDGSRFYLSDRGEVIDSSSLAPVVAQTLASASHSLAEDVDALASGINRWGLLCLHPLPEGRLVCVMSYNSLSGWLAESRGEADQRLLHRDRLWRAVERLTAFREDRSGKRIWPKYSTSEEREEWLENSQFMLIVDVSDADHPRIQSAGLFYFGSPDWTASAGLRIVDTGDETWLMVYGESLRVTSVVRHGDKLMCTDIYRPLWLQVNARYIRERYSDSSPPRRQPQDDPDQPFWGVGGFNSTMLQHDGRLYVSGTAPSVMVIEPREPQPFLNGQPHYQGLRYAPGYGPEYDRFRIREFPLRSGLNAVGMLLPVEVDGYFGVVAICAGTGGEDFPLWNPREPGRPTDSPAPPYRAYLVIPDLEHVSGVPVTPRAEATLRRIQDWGFKDQTPAGGFEYGSDRVTVLSVEDRRTSAVAFAGFQQGLIAINILPAGEVRNSED